MYPLQQELDSRSIIEGLMESSNSGLIYFSSDEPVCVSSQRQSSTCNTYVVEQEKAVNTPLLLSAGYEPTLFTLGWQTSCNRCRNEEYAHLLCTNCHDKDHRSSKRHLRGSELR